MLLRRALLALSAAAAALASSASGDDGSNEQATTSPRTRRLSEEAAARRMARPHRILQAHEDRRRALQGDGDGDGGNSTVASGGGQGQGQAKRNDWIGDSSDYSQADSIAAVTLEDFFKLLDSDCDREFGYKEDMTEEERAEVKQRWEDYAVWDYTRAVEAEEAYYAGDPLVEFGDILYAYVVCTKQEGSAYERKEKIYDYTVQNMGDIDDGGVDVANDADFKANYLAMLETMYNQDEMTCAFGKFRSSIIAVIAGMPGVGVVPLNSFMKVRGGVVDEIMRIAFNSSGTTPHDADGDGDHVDDISFEDMDNMGSADIANRHTKLDVQVCRGVTVPEIERLSGKVVNFMLRKTSDGSSYVAAQSPYANLTDEELADMPERVRFWRNVFYYGIDSPQGCATFLEGLSSEIMESKTGVDDSATVRIELSDITADIDDENEDYNDVACTLGLVWSVALLPQVCSLEMTKVVETGKAQEGSGNAESQWITQGGQAKAGGNKVHTRPFWESGIQGEGQVVAVSDSGIDVDHCYFWDEENGMNPNGGYDMERRKVVQYDAYVDTVDEPAGHGTHVAGTVAGHLSTDGGSTEADGVEDGVARNAKIAFIDMGRYCGPGCGTLSVPPTDRLMGTGREAGARIHSASWGISFIRQGIVYQYDTQARSIDSYTYENYDMLLIVAAGNDGRSRANSMNSPGLGKNVLAVGAGYTSMSRWGQDYLVDFSSEGPTPDGRIAPQIVAPGASIDSSEAVPSDTGECESDGAITSKSGTSMATPAVSGAAALVRQYFVDGFYPTGVKSDDNASIDPSGTLVKAIIINSGQSMEGKIVGGIEVKSVPYDNIQGFGRISLASTLRLSGHSDVVSRIVDSAQIADGKSEPYTVVVNNTICEGRELRATLVWADPPGASGCNSCTINNLDLELTNDRTNEKYYPNGRTDKDNVNNVERVIVPPSALEDGDSWTATVTAANLDRPSQVFSLVMSGCFNFDGQDKAEFVRPPLSTSSSAHIVSSFLVTVAALTGFLYLLV